MKWQRQWNFSNWIPSKFYNSERFGRPDGNFVDRLRVRIKGGTGGSGSASFERSARCPRGRPSGGNGGVGGNVIIIPDPSLDSLNHIPKSIHATQGNSGGRNMRKGAAGKDSIIRVPLGSEITEIVTDDEDDLLDELQSLNNSTPSSILEDDDSPGGDLESYSSLSNFNNESCNHKDNNEDENEMSIQCQGKELEDGNDNLQDYKMPHIVTRGVYKIPIEPLKYRMIESFSVDSAMDGPRIVARGGRGGRGNFSYGMNNHSCELGQAGEERVIEIDLKTIADVGLVGYPNAGKSSFLSAVSNAHPKIAPYPFTTLNPYVGIIEFKDGGRISVADIPGIIEGAHDNKGLGHKFLKHIVKARILALVVDFAKNEPWNDVKILLNELERFQSGLGQKCSLIIANKADLIDAPVLLSRISITKELLYNDDILEKVEILPISALHGLAITRVTNHLRQLVESLSASAPSAVA